MSAIQNVSLNDSVYGSIQLHPFLIKIIQTPEFERLRHIKQLAVAELVYPSATHSRFEHSIGTAHLAGALITHLKEQQGTEYNITNVDVLCVQVAGLLHDIGHGILSHLFEHVAKRLLQKDWKHEAMSVKIIDRLYGKLKESFNQYGIHDNELELIKDMIEFEGSKGEEKMKRLDAKYKEAFGQSWDKVFLFEIVSNHRNGIDVDKFDYFKRDALNLGLTSSFQADRYIQSARIIKNGLPQICLKSSVATDLYQLFHERDQFHRKAYQHKTCSGIEQMIIDALVKANKFYNFKEILENENLDDYLCIDDHVLWSILQSNMSNRVVRRYLTPSNTQENISNIIGQMEDDLKEPNEILKRIVNRRLYKLVGECSIDPNFKITDSDKNEIIDKILALSKLTNSEFQSEDFVFTTARFDYGNGSKNPIENVRFYNKDDLTVQIKLDKDTVSQMLPENFQEHILRLYLKKDIGDDKLLKTRLKNAFEEWKRAVFTAEETRPKLLTQNLFLENKNK